MLIYYTNAASWFAGAVDLTLGALVDFTGVYGAIPVPSGTNRNLLLLWVGV